MTEVSNVSQMDIKIQAERYMLERRVREEKEQVDINRYEVT